MGCLRKIFGVSRISHIRNTDIKNQLNIQHDIVGRIRSCRLRYFGHVIRMQPSRWPHRALCGRVHGNRHRGRPRKRWTDNISDDCQMMGFSLTQATYKAEDRDYWRKYTRLSERASALPWHGKRRMQYGDHMLKTDFKDIFLFLSFSCLPAILRQKILLLVINNVHIA